MIIRVDEISECLDDFLDIGTNLLRGVGVFLKLEVEGGGQLGQGWGEGVAEGGLSENGIDCRCVELRQSLESVGSLFSCKFLEV